MHTLGGGPPRPPGAVVGLQPLAGIIITMTTEVAVLVAQPLGPLDFDSERFAGGAGLGVLGPRKGLVAGLEIFLVELLYNLLKSPGVDHGGYLPGELLGGLSHLVVLILVPGPDKDHQNR